MAAKNDITLLQEKLLNLQTGECVHLSLVRVFSDVLVAFLYFDIVANIKICKSLLNIREGWD